MSMSSYSSTTYVYIVKLHFSEVSFVSLFSLFTLPLHLCCFRQDESASTEARILRIQANECIDSKYNFDRYKDPVDRLGWLINMHPVSKINKTLFLNFCLNVNELN